MTSVRTATYSSTPCSTARSRRYRFARASAVEGRAASACRMPRSWSVATACARWKPSVRSKTDQTSDGCDEGRVRLRTRSEAGDDNPCSRDVFEELAIELVRAQRIRQQFHDVAAAAAS